MLSPKHLRAIKVRRVSIIRLTERPPDDMTPEQVRCELANINAQIDRIKDMAKAEK